MTKKSGVPGKTVVQLQRVQPAKDRQAARGARSAAEQLALLDARPGKSARERSAVVGCSTERAAMSGERCKHCGRAIAGGDRKRGWVHDLGKGSVLGRCNPDESGLPYGYNAEPVGEPCMYPCAGSSS